MYCLSSVGILTPSYCYIPDKWFSVGESVHSSWRSLETWRESKVSSWTSLSAWAAGQDLAWLWVTLVPLWDDGVGEGARCLLFSSVILRRWAPLALGGLRPCGKHQVPQHQLPRDLPQLWQPGALPQPVLAMLEGDRVGALLERDKDKSNF